MGAVQKAESDLLEQKGYEVVKADLFPRDETIMEMDLTAPEEQFHNSFDALVVFDVLEHIPDDRAAVGGIKQLLKPGGQAYIHVPAGDIDAPLNEIDKEHGHVRHGYTEEQIKDVIHSQTFSDVRYLKTFNDVEQSAYNLAYAGDLEAGMELLKQTQYDGKSGRCHMFILTE